MMQWLPLWAEMVNWHLIYGLKAQAELRPYGHWHRMGTPLAGKWSCRVKIVQMAETGEGVKYTYQLITQG
jgi:hypothetical protein